MNTDSKNLLKRIVAKYEGSGDFNGLPIHALDESDPHLKTSIIELITSGDVDLVRGDGHPNPHIKAFPAEPIEVQLDKIEREGLGNGCLYPTPKHLEQIGSGDNEPAPFTRELMLGAPQLDYRVFDLRVLEWYRNDPRYYYEVDEIHGRIHQRSGSEGPTGGVLRDNLEFLEFGFAYDDEFTRGIAVFLRYLHELPADQQQYLAQYQLAQPFKLHPDFYRTQIMGEFPERVSIYDAFLEEKHHVNEMCKLVGKPPLFRSAHKAYERPTGFGILIRPTRKEFRDFVLLLDQLLSDDLNRDFFKGDIPVTEVLTREDGSTTTQSVGTIMLLEKWLRKYFKPQEPEDLDQLLKVIRKVRAERQKPATSSIRSTSASNVN